MAERDDKTYEGSPGELRLPWQIEVREEKPRKLIEEISETNTYSPGDGERKRLGKQILDARRSLDDPPGGCINHREVTDYESLVLKTAINEENEENEEIEKPMNVVEDVEFDVVKNCTVSCDTSDLKEENDNHIEWERRNIFNKRDDDPPERNIINNYKSNVDNYPVKNQLSIIRKDMQEYCANIDKFVEENRIVFKDGQVQSFWGKENTNEGDDGVESKNDEAEKKVQVENEVNSDAEKQERERQDATIKNDKEKEAAREISLLINELVETVIIDDKPRDNTAKNNLLEEKANENESNLEPEFNLNSSEINEQSTKVSEKNDLQVKPENLEEFSSQIINASSGESSAKSDSSAIDDNAESLSTKSAQNVPQDANEIKSKDVLSGTKIEIDEANDREAPTEVNLSMENIPEAARKENVGDADMESLIKTMNSLTLEKGDKGSRQIGKRPGDRESCEIGGKRSFLFHDFERKTSARKSGGKVLERCKQHLLREAKKFTARRSPLTERCVANFIRDAESRGKSRLPKDELRVRAMDCLDLPSTIASLRNRPEIGEEVAREDKSDDSQHFETCTKATGSAEIKAFAKLFDEPADFVAKSPSFQNLLPSYDEFCDYLKSLDDKRKLLIRPEILGRKSDDLSPRGTEGSTERKPTGALIQVLPSEPSAQQNSADCQEPPGDPVDMDVALRAKILENMAAPKTEEEIERARRSANELIKFSREAMVRAKSTDRDERNTWVATRKLFDVVKDEEKQNEPSPIDAGKLTEENGSEKIQTSDESTIEDDNLKNHGATVNFDGVDHSENRDKGNEMIARPLAKSLEMQMAQEK